MDQDGPLQVVVGDIANVRDALGEEVFATTWIEGRAMAPEQAAAYALDESLSA